MNALRQIDADPTGLTERFDRWEERMRNLPFARWFGQSDLNSEMIRVDELRENGEVVIRAELPGIDPDKDVEVTVADGLLHIEAHRREEESKEEKGYVRRELRYGSFMRTLPLPRGISEADVTASYKDGILEIKAPAPPPEPAPDKTTKVAITKG